MKTKQEWYTLLKHFTMPNGEQVPEHLHRGIVLYIIRGIEPGGFLTAVICDELLNAVGRADFDSFICLRAIVGFFYNEVPSQCWGNQKKFVDWMDKGGTHGHENMCAGFRKATP